MARFARVVLGGTFDRLHVGHAALLGAAFRAGRTVAIGLTTDAFLAAHPKPGGARIASYRARRRALARWLARRFPRGRWTIVPLENAFGRSVEDGVDALVVSADTLEGGRRVNAERRRRGRPTVPLLAVPLVLGDDLRPVSSRRIRAGEIDRAGRRRSPISVAIATRRPSDFGATRAGVRRVFPRGDVEAVPFAGTARLAARRAAERHDLAIAVDRGEGGSRRVAVAAGAVTLPAVRVAASDSATLTRDVASLLGRARRVPL